ncbi:MAG: VCBS repeat-containing protein [archaeon]
MTKLMKRMEPMRQKTCKTCPRPVASVPAFEGGAGLAVGDMNGDDRQDIVIAPYKDGKAHIYLVENKDGRRYKKRKIGTVPAFEGGIGLAVGDMNGDEKLDIVVAPYKDGASNVYIFLNNGDGTFSFNGR